jgi:hypothetical protein
MMKKLFESWRGYINESLLLKKGPNGWDQYSNLVGTAYLSAPTYEQRAIPHFEAMIEYIDTMYKRISSNVDIHMVDYHAYANAEELRQDVKKNKRMMVSTIDADHAVFDNMTNAKFRAIHDYLSHVTALKSRGTEFTLYGELQAYNVHLKTASPKAVPALFTEVVGQVTAYYANGEQFAEQKICLLDGFDYYNIGKVEGWDIVNKELIKK